MSSFYPLDQIRTRLQIGDLKRNENAFVLVQKLLKAEGIQSLYTGIVPVCQSVMVSNLVYFYTFHSLKALRGPKSQNVASDLLMGVIAGVLNVLSTTPFWVVNTRIKMKGTGSGKVPYDNLLDGLKHIAKNEGIQKLWSGCIPSLLLVSNPSIQFAVYESIKRYVVRIYGNKLPSMSFFMIGAISKAISTCITYPLQLVQTKLRHGDDEFKKNLPPNSGTLDFLYYIIKEKGFKGLYLGLEAKLWQTILTAALMFMAYEKIARFVTSLLMLAKNK